jgi:beta-glucosidase
MSADQAIRNGTDLMLVNYPTATNDVQFQSTNGAQQAMRQSAHRILYVVVNSRAYEEENYEKATGTPIWQTILTVVDVIVVIGLVAQEVLLIMSYKKKASAK